MRLPIAFVLLLVPLYGVAQAADLNGYNARYECRAGGPVCNVDVAALTTKPCDQVITTSTTPTNDWSAIDWSNNVICIGPGDHTPRGTLRLAVGGSSGAYKVLRYYTSGDTNDEPWNQPAGNRARLRQIDTNGKGGWIIHRLTFEDGTGDAQLRVLNSSNIIVSHSYFTNMDVAAIGISRSDSGSANGNVIQNSVIENGQHRRNLDVIGIDICNATNTRIVNNEIRNPGSHHIQISECAFGTAGTAIENNDLYFGSDVYTNCSGSFTPTGPCAAGEAILSFKDSGTPSNPVVVLHNRIWGARYNDQNVCCTGASGSAISPVGGGTTDSHWYLFQNNIIADSQNAFEWTTWGGGSAINHSVIGNLIYDIQPFLSSTTSAAFWWGGSGAVRKTEFYFNTIVNAASLFSMGTNSELDFRSNLVLDTPSSDSSAGSQSQFMNNAYYNAAVLATSSTSQDIVRSSAAESGDVQYCYWRKLRTAPEKACVDNAMPTPSSPHANAADPSTGSRTGIGIGDAPTL